MDCRSLWSGFGQRRRNGERGSFLVILSLSKDLKLVNNLACQKEA